MQILGYYSIYDNHLKLDVKTEAILWSGGTTDNLPSPQILFFLSVPSSSVVFINVLLSFSFGFTASQWMTETAWTALLKSVVTSPQWNNDIFLQPANPPDSSKFASEFSLLPSEHRYVLLACKKNI